MASWLLPLFKRDQSLEMLPWKAYGKKMSTQKPSSNNNNMETTRNKSLYIVYSESPHAPPGFKGIKIQ